MTLPNAGHPTWTVVLKGQSKLLQDQLVALRRWVEEAGGTEADYDLLAGPVRDLIDELYTVDFPIAKVIDESDLFVHVVGPAAKHTPKVSLLASLFTDIRNGVGGISKTIAQGLATLAGIHLPPEMDLGFTGFAPGSIYLGFKVSAEDTEKPELVEATRKAVRELATVSRAIEEDQEDAIEAIETPQLRDVVLAAVHKISPSNRRGIKSVSLGGRDLGQPVDLTPETKSKARWKLSRPSDKVKENITLAGVVREMDLDERRFVLRKFTEKFEVGSLRCAFDALYTSDQISKSWLDRAVRVQGNLERDRRGVPSLLWLTTIEVLSDEREPEADEEEIE